MPKVLLVGPLPPPVGGATMSFRTFVNAWHQQFRDQPTVLNTSPGAGGRGPFRRLVRGVTSLGRLWWLALCHDHVLIFGSSTSYVKNSYVFSAIQKLSSKRFVVSFFGSDLHDCIAQLPERRRHRVIGDLNRLDRVIVETKNLAEQLAGAGVLNTKTIAGYRLFDATALPPVPRQMVGDSLRLVFLSQVKREKGIFELLHALEDDALRGLNITCDVYGPIDPMVAEEFHQKVSSIDRVRYCGVASGDIVQLLGSYHALILPTWWAGEGHPGVIIEAMCAGIAVVSTRFKAIPELVKDTVNGLLIDPKSVRTLVQAIQVLSGDFHMVQRMGIANRERLPEHDALMAVAAVRQLLQH